MPVPFCFKKALYLQARENVTRARWNTCLTRSFARVRTTAESCWHRYSALYASSRYIRLDFPPHCAVKAKFHYASWFEAGSKLVAVFFTISLSPFISTDYCWTIHNPNSHNPTLTFQNLISYSLVHILPIPKFRENPWKLTLCCR